MALQIFSRLAGTLHHAFRIGPALLKTDAGALVVRNAADTALLPVEAAGLRIPTNAVNGYVWTSDANGNGSWQVAPGGGGGGSGLRMSMLTLEGTLEVMSNPLRIYNATGAAIPITKVFISVSTPPEGGPIIVDVNMDGMTIFTDQSHRPRIEAGFNTGETTLIDVPSWPAGSYLTMDVDQVGSTAPGKDLAVHILYWTSESEDGGAILTVQEGDGTPTVLNVNTIRVPEGALVDEGNGIVSLSFAQDSGASALGDLTDVDLASVPPTDGQALVYDADTALWVPGSVAAGEGSSGAGSLPIPAWQDWTPTFKVGSTTFTLRQPGSFARYLHIGRLVIVQAKLMAASGSASGVFEVGNLPLPMPAMTSGNGVARFINQGKGFYDLAIKQLSSTAIRFSSINDYQDYSSTFNADDPDELVFTLFYETTEDHQPHVAGGEQALYEGLMQSRLVRFELATTPTGTSNGTFTTFPHDVMFHIDTTWYGVKAYVAGAAIKSYRIEVWNTARTTKLAESDPVTITRTGNQYVALPFLEPLQVIAFQPYRVEIIASSAERMHRTSNVTLTIDGIPTISVSGNDYGDAYGIGVYEFDHVGLAPVDVSVPIMSWGLPQDITFPKIQEFAWINQGNASLSASRKGLYLYDPANDAVSYRICKKAAPAPPYTITAAIMPQMYEVNYPSCGIGWRESSTGKLHLFRVLGGSSFKFTSLKATNETTDVGNYVDLPVGSFPSPLWLRIADDGVNRILSWAADGQNFMPLHTVARDDHLVADEVCFFVSSCNSSAPAGMTLLSWKEE